MYKVIKDAYATGTSVYEFKTLKEARHFAKNIYGGAWFDIKILNKYGKVIDENIFGIGWNTRKKRRVYENN